MLSHCPPTTRLANPQLRSSMKKSGRPALANSLGKPFRLYRLLSLILMPAAGMSTTASLWQKRTNLRSLISRIRVASIFAANMFRVTSSNSLDTKAINSDGCHRLFITVLRINQYRYRLLIPVSIIHYAPSQCKSILKI